MSKDVVSDIDQVLGDQADSQMKLMMSLVFGGYEDEPELKITRDICGDLIYEHDGGYLNKRLGFNGFLVDPTSPDHDRNEELEACIERTDVGFTGWGDKAQIMIRAWNFGLNGGTRKEFERTLDYTEMVRIGALHIGSAWPTPFELLDEVMAGRIEAEYINWEA